MSGQTKWLLALGVVGWLGSYLFFFLWFQVNGFAMLGGWKEGFTASVFGTGFLVDLVACTFMTLVLGISDRHKQKGTNADLWMHLHETLHICC